MPLINLGGFKSARRRHVRVCKWAAFASVAAYIASLVWTPFPNQKYAKIPFAADLDGHHFLKYGRPVQILSGSIHYFRIRPELWKDRLITMRAAGLNTIQTFVEWSSHEPEEGQFNFEGRQDLVRFLYIAHSLDIMVILSPGPYIGADRDFGGLPYWLLRNGSSIRLRTSDEKFLSYAKRFLTKVYEKVKPLLITNEGPIIMIQLENKYGSYGACDLEYMRSLRDLTWAQLGRDVVLFTADPAEFKCGHVEGTLATVNFGTGVNAKDEFSRKRRHQKRGPLINSAMVTGWLDHWGKPHRTVNATVIADRIRTILEMGASFNLYMFHGGTNFGFKAGADDEQGFRPQITSYDYEAPISEAGDATEKFKVVRDVIHQFFPGRVNSEIPAQKRKMSLGRFTLKRMFGLKELRQLSSSRAVKSPYPLTFEQVGHAYGLMLYETRIAFQPPASAVLRVDGIRDRGYVYLDNSSSGILSRMDNVLEVILREVNPQQTLSILVENQGRISFGDSLLDPKGIVNNVTLDGRILSGWEMRPIDLSDAAWLRDPVALEQLRVNEGVNNSGLAVYATTFALTRGSPLYDSFLLLDKWTKGVAFLNGFNLGRYWTRLGPQRSLYVPHPLFRDDGNLLVLLELEGVHSFPPGWCHVDFVDEPYFNATPRGSA